MAVTLCRRELLRSALIGATGLVVAACQPKPAAAPQQEAPPTTVPEKEAAAPAPKEAVLLRLHVRQGAEGTKTEMGIEAFQSHNPDIRVKLEDFPGAEYPEKLLTLAAGSVLGDVAFTHVGFYHQMADAGFWTEIDPLVSKYNYDLSVYWQTGLEHMQWNGKLYGLPYKGHTGPSGIFYNKEMLEEVGLTDFQPQDYDEIIEAGKKLVKDTTGDGRPDQWGYLYYGDGGWAITGHLRAWGVDPVSPALGATKAELNGEQQMAAVIWMHELVHKHKICPVPGDLDYKQVFLSGAGGFRSGGLVDWGDRIAVCDRFTMAYASMPKGPGGSLPGFYNHDQMAMNAKTKYPDEAWKLLSYFCGKEHGIRLGKAEGGGASSPGMRKDVWESEELAAEVPCLSLFRAHLDELKTHWYAANLNTFKVWSVMNQLYRAMMIEPTPPTQAVFDEANKAVQAVLDEPRL